MKFSDYKEYLSPVLAKSTDLVAQSAKGCYINTVQGEKYLDFVQGIAVNVFGHCYDPIVSAISEQAGKLINASFNLVNFPSTMELAKKLSAKCPGELGSIFFSNGGAEANDGALKLAKAYTKRPAIISFKGSFHGRTIGATAITGSNAKYRKYYEPMLGSVYFAPYPTRDQCPVGYDEEQRTAFCLNELDNMFKYIISPDTVAAMIVEPIQGEGGYVVPSKSFLQGLRKICTEHGIMLIFDEIQSGYGRTGKMFASEHFGVVPDIMTLGKAIAGGLPMSAIVSTPDIMSEWLPGMHGTTFGGNPVAAAAAVCVLEEMDKHDIMKNVNEMGAYLKDRLTEMKEKYPIMYDVRGMGLMVATEICRPDGTPAGDLFAKIKNICFENKMLVLSCGVNANGMRFATPLNVTKEELDKGLEIFESAVKKVCEEEGF